MGSVVGCISKLTSRAFIIDALSSLEYRGYDSTGCAFLSPDQSQIHFAKIVGSVAELSKLLDAQKIDGSLSIGHMRWATHGAILQRNAHPQFDCTKNIAIVHNGIIENYHELSLELRQHGHAFHSDTDTEVISHLLESLLWSNKNIKAALLELSTKLIGSYAFLALIRDYKDLIVAVRKRSPLAIGVGLDQIFVASDPMAFAHKSNKVLFMPDCSIALIRLNQIELYDFDGNSLPLDFQSVNTKIVNEDKGAHDHFMLKEIYEQKKAINASINFYRSISKNVWKHLDIEAKDVHKFKSISLVGSGSSWHATRIAQFFFETVCNLHTHSFVASEFRHMPFFPDADSLYILISQSGETADTIEALRLINSFNLPTVALTNVASSTLLREANGFLLTQAGSEVAIASTKAFTTQLAALYWLAHKIACERGVIPESYLEAACQEIQNAAQILETSIENYSSSIIHSLAPRYAQYKQFIFIGRHITYPLALEAALKLKEVSYIFAQCYPAGELKHGPLALIDASTPVIIFSHPDQLIYQKLLANAQEIKAREGHLIVFAFEGQHELEELADTVFIVPRVNPLLAPIAFAGLIQFFVYQIANCRGCPIDRPRNISKASMVG